jgi:hypothetical protein
MADVRTEETKTPKPPIPGWAWLFIALIVAIPILTLGGAIPGAIGGGGGFGCAQIARDPEKPTPQKVLLCAIVTIACWAIFIIFLGGISVLQARF